MYVRIFARHRSGVLTDLFTATPSLYSSVRSCAMIHLDHGRIVANSRSKNELHGQLDDSRIAGVEPVVPTDIAQNLTER